MHKLGDMDFDVSEVKEMTLKTLKDFNEQDMCREDLKQEAIKWVKEDIKEFGLFKDAISSQSRKWMERFNITESDLKQSEGGKKK